MWKPRVSLTGFVVAAVALTGACSDTQPIEPQATNPDTELFRTGPQDPAAFVGGLDAVFVRIAQEMPGFGGLFYDEAHRLNVYMSGAQAMSSARVASTLQPWTSELGIPSAALGDIVLLRGDYDFAELAAMRARADQAVWSVRGVVFTDADEALNRVHIGVEDEAARAAVERAIEMLDLPREAVTLSLAEPERPMQSLRDRVRPVAGGLQINFPGFLCTLGFNVRSPDRPNVEGFVTNSHCSTVRGEVTDDPYWQPSSGVPDSFIGTEAHDIPYFTDGPCPAGSLCRWSDAAGVQYEEGVENEFGAIYRPTGIGSLNIDPNTPRFQITDEGPRTILGDSINKVGRTTGWSSGTISASCVNIGVAGENPPVVMLCQDRFAMTPGTQGGDSGSPMFQRLGENDVRLVGILWGTTTFSPMENIRFENQGPVPWITFPGQTPPPPPGGPPGPP